MWVMFVCVCVCVCLVILRNGTCCILPEGCELSLCPIYIKVWPINSFSCQSGPHRLVIVSLKTIESYFKFQRERLVASDRSCCTDVICWFMIISCSNSSSALTTASSPCQSEETHRSWYNIGMNGDEKCPALKYYFETLCILHYSLETSKVIYFSPNFTHESFNKNDPTVLIWNLHDEKYFWILFDVFMSVFFYF